MTKWLSNKWNLIGLYALCSLLMGIILYDKLTFTELAVIYALMGAGDFVIYILGVGRGMLLHAMNNDIHEFLKRLREEAKKAKDKDE